MDQICTEMHYEDVSQFVILLRKAIDDGDVWHVNVNRFVNEYFMSRFGNGAFVLLSPDNRIIDCGSFMLVLRHFDLLQGSKMGWIMTKNDGIKLIFADCMINNDMYLSALDDTLALVLTARDPDDEDVLIPVHPISRRATGTATIMALSSILGGDTYVILQSNNSGHSGV